jgi:hypothetical protein
VIQTETEQENYGIEERKEKEKLAVYSYFN